MKTQFILQEHYENMLRKKSTTIQIVGKLYKELYNVQYILAKDHISQLLELQNDFIPATTSDQQEREHILKWFNDTTVFDDNFTRQAVLQPKYEDRQDLAACLSLIQVILRPNIDIHIFVRSQHFDRNFMYDNITYALLMKQMTEKIKTVEMNKIFVKIVSLHKDA